MRPSRRASRRARGGRGPGPTGRGAEAVGRTARAEAGGAVQNVRAEKRPSGWQWATGLCESWVELKGLDPVLRAGIATINGRRMIMIACDRHVGAGRLTPKAYQLARRALKMADRLRLPFVPLVATPGSETGPEPERAGSAVAMATAVVAQAPRRARPAAAVSADDQGRTAAARPLVQEARRFRQSADAQPAQERRGRRVGRQPWRRGRLCGNEARAAGADLRADGVLPSQD